MGRRKEEGEANAELGGFLGEGDAFLPPQDLGRVLGFGTLGDKLIPERMNPAGLGQARAGRSGRAVLGILLFIHLSLPGCEDKFPPGCCSARKPPSLPGLGAKRSQGVSGGLEKLSGRWYLELNLGENGA